MTDRGLIEQYVRHKSEAAFSQLVERHSRLVYSTCKRDLGDVLLAEECTQAVFLILARKAGGLRGRDSVAGWLFKTARLAARDVLKQEIRRQKREGAILERMHLETEREFAAWRTVEPVLNDALESLPLGDREVILMRFFDQLSMAEIASSIGVKEDTARMRVSRAVDRLRGRMVTQIGAGATMLAGIALADLLSNRAAEAAPPHIIAKLTVLGHSTVSSTSGLAGFNPQAQSIAQGALKAMSRIRAIQVVAAVVCVAVVVSIASVPLIAQSRRAASITTAALAHQGAISPTAAPIAAGYAETYRYTTNGQDTGTETATLTASTPSGQTWSFNTNLQGPGNGPSSSVKEDGTVGLSPSGHPLWLKLNATLPTSQQTVSMDFAAQPATMNATVNGQNVAAPVPYNRAQYLNIGGNLSFLSIMFRNIPRPDGKTIYLPFFSVDGPFSGMYTWTSMGKEPVSVGGKSVTCSIYDCTDIKIDQALPAALQPALQANIGQRIWVDGQGSILKLTSTKSSVVIVRE